MKITESIELYNSDGYLVKICSDIEEAKIYAYAKKRRAFIFFLEVWGPPDIYGTKPLNHYEWLKG